MAILRAGNRGSRGVVSYTRTRRGVGIRQRREQHAFEQAEDRHGGADPDRQRQQRDEAEAGILAEHPDRVGGVLAQLVEPRQAALIPERFRRRVDAAEPGAGPPARFIGRRAAIALQFFLHLEMERQLVVQLGVTASAADRSEEARDPRDQARIVIPPTRAGG
jgi:hypothetical protein